METRGGDLPEEYVPRLTRYLIAHANGGQRAKRLLGMNLSLVEKLDMFEREIKKRK